MQEPGYDRTSKPTSRAAMQEPGYDKPTSRAAQVLGYNRTSKPTSRAATQEPGYDRMSKLTSRQELEYK